MIPFLPPFRPIHAENIPDEAVPGAFIALIGALASLLSIMIAVAFDLPVIGDWGIRIGAVIICVAVVVIVAGLVYGAVRRGRK